MNIKKFKEKYENKIKKRNKVIKKTIDFKWITQISALTFVISIVLSSGSTMILESVNIYLGLLVVLFFILVGVLFDMIGIAVASADEKPFHSMAAKRIRASKVAIRMIKNAEKVSSFCNDVVGDICNIISGSAGAVIAVILSTKYNVQPMISALLVTSLIASFTIGGKAMGKSYAINKSEVIIYKFAKILNIFKI